MPPVGDALPHFDHFVSFNKINQFIMTVKVYSLYCKLLFTTTKKRTCRLTKVSQLKLGQTFNKLAKCTGGTMKKFKSAVIYSRAKGQFKKYGNIFKII